jgi:hypothetical protein
MSKLSRSRAAQRGARTRVLNAARRGTAAPRPTAEVDAERAARGRETLAERRGGLPPRSQVRKAHTHVDALTGGLLVATGDEHTFGMLITRPIAVGDQLDIRGASAPIEPSGIWASAPAEVSSAPARLAVVKEIWLVGNANDYVRIGIH